MQVPTFQALCLLPDSGPFLGFVLRKDRHGKLKRKRYPKPLTLEETVDIVEKHSVRLVRGNDFGYLLKIGRAYIKVDGKKAKAYADSCGVKFKARKPKTQSPAPLVADANDAKFIPSLK